ncbi:hypothetical protein QYF36_010402 [Acer negundo]|nr:hypothetical protein QYF36_010402 [Acer negundo]
MNSITSLLHTIITSGNSDPKLNKLPGPTVSLKQTAPSLYIQAWLTMGKLYQANNNLAKRYIPLFVQELQKSDSAALRNNLVVMMTDFCVCYTALKADIYTALKVVTEGLCEVERSADFLFGNILEAKAPLLAYNSFVEAIFVLNNRHAHTGHNDSKGSQTQRQLFSIRAIQLPLAADHGIAQVPVPHFFDGSVTVPQKQGGHLTIGPVLQNEIIDLNYQIAVPDAAFGVPQVDDHGGLPNPRLDRLGVYMNRYIDVGSFIPEGHVPAPEIGGFFLLVLHPTHTHNGQALKLPVHYAERCSICLEEVSSTRGRTVVTLRCSHMFHPDCIGSFFNVDGIMQCPNCRRIPSFIFERELIPFMLDNNN